MSNEPEESEEKKTENEAAPAGRRPSADFVSSWLEHRRRTEAMLNPPLQRLFSEQQSWLKAMSGAAAMSAGIPTRFSTRDFLLAKGALADYERTRRLAAGFGPVFDASKQLRALTSVGAFPALNEAALAHERITRLIKPLDVTQITRDLSGVSDAVASVAGMVRSPALAVGGEIATIASSALGSWRTYVDSLPSALDTADLLHARAAARGALGITASSAILLGDDDAVALAEEWELAPTDMRERMREGLRQISPRLVVRLDGAWDAVTHAGPDSVSQAANSAIELVDWTLRLACDETGLESWVVAQPKPAIYRDRNGRPTRQAKIRYLLRGRDFEADFVDATARNIDALRGELQKLKHTHGEHDVDAVARLLPTVEAVLFLVVE